MRQIILAITWLILKFCFVCFCNYWASCLIYNELRTLHVVRHLVVVWFMNKSRCHSHAIDFVHVWDACETCWGEFGVMLCQLSITPRNLSLLLPYQVSQVIITAALSSDLAALIVLQYLPLFFIFIAHLLKTFFFNLFFYCLFVLLCRHVSWVCC